MKRLATSHRLLEIVECKHRSRIQVSEDCRKLGLENSSKRSYRPEEYTIRILGFTSKPNEDEGLTGRT